MTVAKQALEELSRDPVTRRLAREREDALKLYRMDLTATKLEGKLEGKAEALLELLHQRFGSLPERTRARIMTASSTELDTWLGQVLTAQSLDELLA